MSRPDRPAVALVGGIDQGPSSAVIHSVDTVARPTGVLIVDDDEGVRRVLGAGLWLHGFAVWLAADARDAVETYRSHREGIDVALLDVRMPGRDGPRTLADLRDVDPGVRACFMTGEAGQYTDQNLLDLGAVAVFRKAFALSELAVRLASLATPTDPPGGVQEARRRDDGGRGNSARR